MHLSFKYILLKISTVRLNKIAFEVINYTLYYKTYSLVDSLYNE